MSQTQNTRALRVKEAASYLGIGVSTFWRWSKEGRLPKPIHLSSRCSVWRMADLEAFIERQAQDVGAAKP